jgi:hypothetical protein
MPPPHDQLPFLERVKRIAIVAMFSDDRLMDELVLKGAAALDFGYGASSRASLDLDFSMGDEFEAPDALLDRISRCLVRAFQEHNLVAFDIDLVERPPELTDDMRDFWGGYLVVFKVTTPEEFGKYASDMETLRRHAKVVGANNSKTFEIDISKHEYCDGKVEKEIDGYTIFMYSPPMICGEKVRAICQQMPEYGPIVKRHRPSRGRAKDFLDIHILCEVLGVDFAAFHFQDIVKQMFAIKRVPLRLIGEIQSQREFHRLDFVSVLDTVKPGTLLKSFDEYFDYVVEKCRALEVLWKINPPI